MARFRASPLLALLVLCLLLVSSYGSAQQSGPCPALRADQGSGGNALWEHFEGVVKGEMVDKWFNYFDVYERYFSRYRDKPVRFLEIGVQSGGSLAMWRKYFTHPDARFYGVDINPYAKPLFEDAPQLTIFTGSQSNRTFLKDVVAQTGGFDIVLDDGGHTMEQQIAAIEELYSSVTLNGGIYMVEDTATSYWRDFGGTTRASEAAPTMIWYAKRLVDKLYGWHFQSRDFKEEQPAEVLAHGPPDFLETTVGISFFDQMIVFEKGSHPPPTKQRRGSFAIPFTANLGPGNNIRLRLLERYKQQLAEARAEALNS